MNINREKRFNETCKASIMSFGKDVVLQTVQMIDENGEIQQTTKKVEINETDMISSIPAYTTKIEYMQQYGVLNDVGEVKLKTAPVGMSEIDVMALRNSIIENNLNEVKNKLSEENNNKNNLNEN